MERSSAARTIARAAGRDIGPIPPCADPSRRHLCSDDLPRFCTTYLAAQFPLAFSDDHRRALGLLQAAVLEGGQFAVAMPRGSGKTTMCRAAVLWALLYGHRRFVFVVAADGASALSIVAALRSELEHNDEVLADFPEAAFPIRALKGISRRAEGQTSESRQTFLVWTKDEVRLPAIAEGGGSVIRAAGITGNIRGASASMTDGAQIRPDLVLVDDPQTDESARSPSQVETRMRILCGTILGLAGPGERIAALTTCTVIAPGDMAAQLLDRKAHPEWQGYRARLMDAMPTATALWDRYAEILAEELRCERGMAAATDYYREHRDAMDAGARAAWPERYDRGTELSATQHAMNLRITRGEAAFLAEYQNEPQDLSASSDVEQVTAPAVLRKINRIPQWTVPSDSTALTAAIDVQGKALYWMACAWSPGFSGDVLAYGAHPDQGRPYFTLHEVERTIEKTHPGVPFDAALYAALDELMAFLCDREWQREGGGVQRVQRVLIDAGWGKSTDVIYQFARRSRHSALIFPYFGRTVIPGAAPMTEWKRKPGERQGLNWRIPKPTARATRHVIADASWWKSHAADRVLAPPGSAGSLGLYGYSASVHRMLADHLSAEIRTRVSANGRTADRWDIKPNTDNHFLDTLSMNCIAASIEGIALDPKAVPREQRRTQDEPESIESAPMPATIKPTSDQPRPPRPRPRAASTSGWLVGY